MRVHALVQRAAIEHLEPELPDSLIKAAADGLLEVWPEIERDPQLGQVLRANAATLASHPGTVMWNPDGHPLLWRAGKSLGEAGLLTAAIAHWRRLADTAGQVLGPDHPGTLSACSNLASWRGEAGDAAGAAAAFEQLLADRLRVLGRDHPDTLSARNNLAS